MNGPFGEGRSWAIALAALALLATLGEGGATPTATLVVHGGLAATICFAALAPGSLGGTAPAAGPVAAFAVFSLWAVLGAVRAPYAFGAWLVILEIASFAAAFWLASRSAEPIDRVLPPALAAAAFLHAVFAMWEKLAGEPRPATTFLNPNHLGAWLVASGLVVLGWAMGGGRRRVLGSVAATMALAGMAATESRGALVALVVGIATLVALRWRTESRKVRSVLVVGACTAILAAATLVASRLGDADPYHWERFRIWRASLQAVGDDPWFGTGPGQFKTAAANLNFPQEASALRYGRTFRSPHSDLIRAGAEFGVPAAVAALAAIWLAVREIARRRRSRSGSPLTNGYVAAVAALGAQSLFDDLSTRPAVLLLGAVLAGRLLARRAARQGSWPFRFRGAAAVAIVTLFLVGELAPWMAWREVRTLPRGRLDAASVERLHSVLERNPLHPDGWRRLAEHEVGDGRDWDAAGYARAREAAERAIRLQPADARYRRVAAWVEGMACRTLFGDRATRERAVAQYRAAADLARTDATIPLDEALFLLGTGDAEGARRAAERALRIEPRSAVPRVVLAEALLEIAGPESPSTARQLLEEALGLGLGDDLPESPYESRLAGVDRQRVASLLDRVPGVEP